MGFTNLLQQISDCHWNGKQATTDDLIHVLKRVTKKNIAYFQQIHLFIVSIEYKREVVAPNKNDNYLIIN